MLSTDGTVGPTPPVLDRIPGWGQPHHRQAHVPVFIFDIFEGKFSSASDVGNAKGGLGTIYWRLIPKWKPLIRKNKPLSGAILTSSIDYSQNTRTENYRHTHAADNYYRMAGWTMCQFGVSSEKYVELDNLAYQSRE
jgi:hypothetical protein